MNLFLLHHEHLAWLLSCCRTVFMSENLTVCLRIHDLRLGSLSRFNFEKLLVFACLVCVLLKQIVFGLEEVVQLSVTVVVVG